jgi:ribosome-associated protein
LMQEQRQETLPREYDATTIARDIVDVIVDKKGSDVALLEIGRVTTLADYFVIATGTSDRQIRALSNSVQERMRELQIALLHEEGLPADGWLLLDYGQIIVHLFGTEQRAYYDLERRWQEAPTLVRIL